MNNTINGETQDMFDPIFAQKKNISLEKRLITDKKIELIKD